MNVWFHSNNNDWEESVIDLFLKNKYWINVYNTSKFIENNPLAVNDYFKKKSFTSYSDVPLELVKFMAPHIYKFIDMYSRNSKNDQNSYLSFDIHEYLNIFNLIINYYHKQFTEKKINLVFFNRAPHVGYDYISYFVAKYHKIETLILEQSHFENRFFYYWDHYDFGNFETSNVKFPHSYVEIEKKFEKNLVYMRDERKFNDKLKLSQIYRKYPMIKLIREFFDKDLKTGAFSKYEKEILFRRNSIKYEVQEKSIDFDTPFIYFGLHLQPEKTTSAWGGLFTDQLLAIEQLSQKLPKNWKIYVKENPKQGYYMRDKYFYERLKFIPNTILIDKNINTYKLLNHCKMAATITGTIGWECITGGKPVIIFGWGTWYKSFKGVYIFQENLDIESIVDNFSPLSKKEIETKLNLILDYTGKGVIYNKGWYKTIVKDYSTESNIMNIYTSLYRILKNKFQASICH